MYGMRIAKENEKGFVMISNYFWFPLNRTVPGSPLKTQFPWLI